MMKRLHLNIVSPEKELFNGEVESVTLPGTMGSFLSCHSMRRLYHRWERGNWSTQRTVRNMSWIFKADSWR